MHSPASSIVSLERRTLLRTGGALGASALLGGAFSRNAFGADTVQVGSMSPLTGSQAAYGTFIQQGQSLFTEQFNKAGGFGSGPEKGKQLVVLYEDDGEGTGTPDAALSAFRKLVQVNGVKAVTGVVLSSVALPLAPIAESAKCVFVAIDPTTPKLSQYKNFFRITETSDTAGPTYAACVLKAGFKNINFIWVNDPAGVGTHEKFIPAYQALGGKIALDLAISAGATDFRTEITKCMASGADCNVLLAHEGEILVIMKQASNLGFVAPKTQWFSNYYSDEMLQKGGAAFENSYAKQYHVPRETEAYQNFEHAFRAKYGPSTEIAYFTMAAYDALNAIAKAIEIGGYDFDGMNAALHSMNFQGVSKRIHFNVENGDNVTTAQDVFKVVNGKYVVQFTYDPAG
jgi:branched-chain amino acid transport system substrate-binding protein